MSRPLVIRMLRLRRCVRFLKGHRTLEWQYDYQVMPRQVLYEVDSDWAEDEETRKSTNSIYGFFGVHLLETQVAAQAVIALSSGEAEFYAIGRGAASAIMMRLFYGECGVAVKSQVCSDSNAGRAIASRIGSGRVRHLQIRGLWLQERVRAGELELGRVNSADNRSDLGTQYLERGRIMKLLEITNLRLTTKGLAAGMVAVASATEMEEGRCTGLLREAVRIDGSSWYVPVLFMIVMVIVCVCHWFAALNGGLDVRLQQEWPVARRLRQQLHRDSRAGRLQQRP